MMIITQEVRLEQVREVVVTSKSVIAIMPELNTLSISIYKFVQKDAKSIVNWY